MATLSLSHRVSIGVAGLALTAAIATSGTWSDLPDAVLDLQVSPRDAAAERVVAAAERDLVAEAEAGRVEAVVDLVAVYTDLVSPLEGSGPRIERVHRRIAEALVRAGDRMRAGDLSRAATLWTVAARLADGGEAIERLRPLIEPPPDPEPGQSWTSPLDAATLIWFPPRPTRVGCSDGDRLCRDNEIYFRYLELEGFWVELTEVSVGRYEQCVKAGWCDAPVRPPVFAEGVRPEDPVVGVTWSQAARYARWMGRRLPSEAEWEGAARGGDDRHRYPWGNSRTGPPARVFAGGADGSWLGPAPVASYPPTEAGLHDVVGNVWEWCADRYTERLQDLPTDGSPWLGDGPGRVVRGGSWRRTIEVGRVSTRFWYEEEHAADDLGFRCVVSGDPRPDAALLEVAAGLWPEPPVTSAVLAGSDLDLADRRYLERRALTWLVLEDRLEEALRRAAQLEGAGIADGAASAMIKDVEGRILELARQGSVAELPELLRAYREAARSEPRLAERGERTLQQVVRELRAAGQRDLERGARELAARRFAIALELEPGDPLVQLSLQRAQPDVGTRRVWPGDGREMVWIPARTVQIGASRDDRAANANEHPARRVELAGFWIDSREVSNRDYRQCVDAGACDPPRDPIMFDDPNLADHPVLWVDWFQARDYARWAGKRLPSEAEWEAVARGGGLTPFAWGLTWQPGRCNSLGLDEVDRWGGSAPVASFPSGPWGVFDMIGNAGEWVADYAHRDYRGAPRDGRPWRQLTGGFVDLERVIRGGDYESPPERLRVSHRASRAPESVHRTVGFRCAADPE